MYYLQEALFLLVLFAPTFIANATPVIIKNIHPFSLFAKPICEKYLGKNKTYRGFISGVFFAVFFSLLIYIVLGEFTHYQWGLYYSVILNYKIALLAGFLQGFGALFGDVVESFIKRKLGKAPGSPWFFWDGVDYIIGSLLFFSVIYFPGSIFGVLFLFFVAPAASLIGNTVAFLFGWKNVWH